LLQESRLYNTENNPILLNKPEVKFYVKKLRRELSNREEIEQPAYLEPNCLYRWPDTARGA